MNVRDNVLVLPSIVVALAATTVGIIGAQSHVAHGGVKPAKKVTLDLATGTITRGPRVEERAGTTVTDFDNIDLAPFIGFDTGGGACEWIDAGEKGFVGNTSDLMSRVVFAYCTVMLDPASGGPGASTLIGFYEGYPTGGPAPTTSVALLNLTGLPGHSIATSFINFGAGKCYFIDVNFANSIAFADGPIGYSWRFTDLGTTGLYGGTFPYLACVESCLGPGPDGQGMDNLIDRYHPPGTFLQQMGTAQFLGLPMAIAEVADAEATANTWNSQGINTDALSATAMAIGHPWQVDITLAHAHGASGPTNVKVRAACLNGPNLASPTGHAIEVLTSGSLALTLADPHNGASTTYAPFAVPADIALVGVAWAAQGTVIGGGRVDLTTARCGVVGSIDAIADP